MNMKPLHMLQIIFIVFGVLGWDSTVFVQDMIDDQISEKDRIIHGLQVALSQEVETRIIDRNTYKSSITRIVSDIYRSDSFLNVGGENEYVLDYDDDMILQLMNDHDSTYQLDQLLQVTENFFHARVEYFDDVPSIWPLKQHELNRITSPFGPRFDPFGKRTIGIHKGIDLASIWKAEIVATADGIIQDHWIYHKEFGRCIRIDHGNGFQTFYGHLAISYVHEGEKVERGQVIGLMGNTGKANGAHLHYEIVKEGVKVDPINYLREQIGEEPERYVYEIQ